MPGGSEWSIHAPAALFPGKNAGSQWIGRWFDPRINLDDMERRKSVSSDGIRLSGRPDRIHKTDNEKGI